MKVRSAEADSVAFEFLMCFGPNGLSKYTWSRIDACIVQGADSISHLVYLAQYNLIFAAESDCAMRNWSKEAEVKAAASSESLGRAREGYFAVKEASALIHPAESSWTTDRDAG